MDPLIKTRRKENRIYKKFAIQKPLLPTCQPYRSRTRALAWPWPSLSTGCPLNQWCSTSTEIPSISVHIISTHTLPIASTSTSLLTSLLCSHHLSVVLRIHRVIASICEHGCLLQRAWSSKAHGIIGVTSDGIHISIASSSNHCLMSCIGRNFVQLLRGHAGNLLGACLRVAGFELRGDLVHSWGHTTGEGLGLSHTRRCRGALRRRYAIDRRAGAALGRSEHGRITLR